MKEFIDLNDVLTKYKQEDFYDLYESLNLKELGYKDKEIMYPLEGHGDLMPASRIQYMILRYIKGEGEHSAKSRVYFVYMESGYWGEMILLPGIPEPKPGQLFEYTIGAHHHPRGILMPRLTIYKQSTILKQGMPTFKTSKIGYPLCKEGFKVKIVHELWKMKLIEEDTYEDVNPYIEIADNIWNSRNINTLSVSELAQLQT